MRLSRVGRVDRTDGAAGCNRPPSHLTEARAASPGQPSCFCLAPTVPLAGDLRACRLLPECTASADSCGPLARRDRSEQQPILLDHATRAARAAFATARHNKSWPAKGCGAAAARRTSQWPRQRAPAERRLTYTRAIHVSSPTYAPCGTTKHRRLSGETKEHRRRRRTSV